MMFGGGATWRDGKGGIGGGALCECAGLVGGRFVSIPLYRVV